MQGSITIAQNIDSYDCCRSGCKNGKPVIELYGRRAEKRKSCEILKLIDYVEFNNLIGAIFVAYTTNRSGSWKHFPSVGI